MSIQNSSKKGVILMTYGSATTAEHVREYFERIYPGKASPELIADFENRYRLVGSSPLIDITKKQAALLEKRLGENYIVRAGMRHSHPFITDTVSEIKAAGATSLIGIILAPQFSSFIMQGYNAAFSEAARKSGFEENRAVVVGPWGTESHFVQLLARNVITKLGSLQQEYGHTAPIVFTTHSLPQRVVESDPNYLVQLSATIEAIRAHIDPHLEWYAAYQSAGHTPEAWLKPDLVDILEKLREKKSPAVLIVPIQFLADHLEILYDLDVAARDQCKEFNIAYHRTNLPNTDPLFIESLASLVTVA
jgi:protoporphyrin/coproporphyrin ferrochelatase